MAGMVECPKELGMQWREDDVNRVKSDASSCFVDI